MSQRTGRKVSADVASLPSKAKKAAPAVGAVEAMPELHDGSKAPATAPKAEHKGPEGMSK